MYYLVSKPYPKRQKARTIKHSSLFAEQLASHGKILDAVEAYLQHVAGICTEENTQNRNMSEQTNTPKAEKAGKEEKPKHRSWSYFSSIQ